MNCILMWLSTCIIDPSNVYLTAGLSDHQNGRYDQAICTNKQGWWHRCRGPLADLKIGTVIEISGSVSLDVGYFHRSFIQESNDEGTNGFSVSMTYRPWRK